MIKKLTLTHDKQQINLANIDVNIFNLIRNIYQRHNKYHLLCWNIRSILSKIKKKDKNACSNFFNLTIL